jgi:hypothetical protein
VFANAVNADPDADPDPEPEPALMKPAVKMFS